LLTELRHRRLVRGTHVGVAGRRARRPEQRLLSSELTDGLVAEPLRERRERLRSEEVGRLGLPRPPIGGAPGDAAALHLEVDHHMIRPPRAAKRAWSTVLMHRQVCYPQRCTHRLYRGCAIRPAPTNPDRRSPYDSDPISTAA